LQNQHHVNVRIWFGFVARLGAKQHDSHKSRAINLLKTVPKLMQYLIKPRNAHIQQPSSVCHKWTESLTHLHRNDTARFFLAMATT